MGIMEKKMETTIASSSRVPQEFSESTASNYGR